MGVGLIVVFEVSSAWDDHYSTVDPLPGRNNEDQSITNSTRQQDEQLDGALPWRHQQPVTYHCDTNSF